MIRIENTEVYGWETAIRGMRNPMNSWDKSNSSFINTGYITEYSIGENDIRLMKSLVSAGTDHSKFMRMITVTCDIIAPMYWWKEFDTYKVGTVRNSCSTMHKIHEKEFTIDDFSHEHLTKLGISMLADTINTLNMYRTCYVHGRKFDDPRYGMSADERIFYFDLEDKKEIKPNDKRIWWQIIQLLPSSYNQRSTVQLNYQVLRSMYHSRKNHKLDEWQTFCEWIKSLPYSELITGEEV